MARPVSAQPPVAAVIIPHFRDHARLRLCLRGLSRQPEAAMVEVIVVDDGSPEGTGGLAVEFPDVRFLTSPHAGAAAARNIAVNASRARLLFFIDADCRPAADWLRVGLAVAPLADVTGGRVDLFDEGGSAPRTGAQAYETLFAFDCRRYVERCGFAVTANLVTRRDVFDRVGPFRSGLAEDRDWCARARAAGFGLRYDERLAVAHPTRGDWPALAAKHRRLVREAHGALPAGRGARLGWLARAAAQPMLALAALPRIVLSPRLAGPVERARAGATAFVLRWCRARWMLRAALSSGPGRQRVRGNVAMGRSEPAPSVQPWRARRG